MLFVSAICFLEGLGPSATQSRSRQQKHFEVSLSALVVEAARKAALDASSLIAGRTRQERLAADRVQTEPGEALVQAARGEDPEWGLAFGGLQHEICQLFDKSRAMARRKAPSRTARWHGQP